MPRPRRGSVLPFAIVMMGVVMALVVGMMSWFNASLKRSQDDRWRVIAADAAQSGLSMMLAWARAHVDRTRTTPPEWDVGDGAVANPLRSLFASADFREDWPAGAVSGAARPNIGSRAAPVVAGDVIDPTGVGEYVVGRYGDYVATFRVRLQPFRLAENAPRQYKIAVAGRVRAYDERQAAGGPFRGSRLVADRVVLATVGKQPLSRFAALVDIDQVNNWAPGEMVEGPVHVNRGYVDYPAADRPANVSTTYGRSKMMINAPGGFTPPAGGPDHPTFFDAVSLTYKPDDPAFPDAADYRNVVELDDRPLSDGGYTAAKARTIFQAPENQAKIDGKAGPQLVRDPIALPPNSRARLAAALGVPEGRAASTLPWFPGLLDGVYVPTRAMVDDRDMAFHLGADRSPAGGIYVRGQVEVMRAAVVGDRSYYMFQLGYVKAAAPRRCYMVVADRATRMARLVAFPRGQALRDLLAGAGNDPAALAATVPDRNATLDEYAVAPTPGGATAAYTFEPTAGAFPFNGLLFVDYSLHDPIRTAAPLTLTTPGNAVAPLTGSILALGDPGAQAPPYAKTRISTDPALPAFMEGAEVFCTEAPGGAPAQASKLMIIASGDIFIQNHLVVRGVAEACALDASWDSLRRDNVRLTQTRDLVGIVADKQIVVGMTAPGSGSRGAPGVTVMAALAALGDPAYNFRLGRTDPLPPDPRSPDGMAFRVRGSFATEALIPAMTGDRPERYDVLWPGDPGVFAGKTPAQQRAIRFTDADRYRLDGDSSYPYNPLYDPAGPVGGYPTLMARASNPNIGAPRGNLTVFGALVTKKRGTVGLGNRSYDKDYRYDQRLLTIAPPLFPNSLNIVTYITRLDALGLPPYRAPEGEPAMILND